MTTWLDSAGQTLRNAGRSMTCRKICQRVNDLMQETMRDPVILQRMNTQVLEPVTESIAESKAFVAREIERASVLLKSVNYQPE